MGSSITLLRFRGIDVRIHWSFILVLLYGAFNFRGVGSQPASGAIYGVVVILLLFVCVLLHEFGHALVAQFFQINVPSITLLPIGGVASLERMPDKPFQEFLIAIAGPLVNFVIASLLFPVWLLVTRLEINAGLIEPFARTGNEVLQQIDLRIRTPGTGNLLLFLIVSNLSLGIFNLLPAFPMDGGRILRSVLATAMAYIQATRIAVLVGRVLAIILAIWGVMDQNIFTLLLAFFVYIGGGAEQEALESRAILKDIKIADALTAGATNLYSSERVKRAVDLIMTSYQIDYPVLDLAGQFVGVLTRARLIAALRELGPEARVVDVMLPADQLPTAAINGNLADVWEKMTSSGSRIVIVRDGNEYRGLLTLDDITELIQVIGANFERNLKTGATAQAEGDQLGPSA